MWCLKPGLKIIFHVMKVKYLTQGRKLTIGFDVSKKIHARFGNRPFHVDTIAI